MEVSTQSQCSLPRFNTRIAALYSAIHNFVIGSPRYAELTVEDPSEDFEDLRDKVDLRMLLARTEFIREAYGTEGARQSKSSLVKTDGKVKDKNGKGKEELPDSENAVPGKSGTKSSTLGMLGPPTRTKWAERWRKELKFAKVRRLNLPIL
jgi:histone acetyltransferase 1